MGQLIRQLREKLFCAWFKYRQRKCNEEVRKQMDISWDQAMLRDDLACCIYWSGVPLSHTQIRQRLDEDYALTVSSLSSALELGIKKTEKLYIEEPQKLRVLFENAVKSDFDLRLI